MTSCLNILGVIDVDDVLSYGGIGEWIHPADFGTTWSLECFCVQVSWVSFDWLQKHLLWYGSLTVDHFAATGATVSKFIIVRAIFVGRQLCWKDHLDFCCHAVFMYGWMDDVGFSSTLQQKGKP